MIKKLLLLALTAIWLAGCVAAETPPQTTQQTTTTTTTACPAGTQMQSDGMCQ
jgi:hypothetical protein